LGKPFLKMLSDS